MLLVFKYQHVSASLLWQNLQDNENTAIRLITMMITLIHFDKLQHYVLCVLVPFQDQWLRHRNMIHSLFHYRWMSSQHAKKNYNNIDHSKVADSHLPGGATATSLGSCVRSDCSFLYYAFETVATICYCDNFACLVILHFLSMMHDRWTVSYCKIIFSYLQSNVRYMSLLGLRSNMTAWLCFLDKFGSPNEHRLKTMFGMKVKRIFTKVQSYYNLFLRSVEVIMTQ